MAAKNGQKKGTRAANASRQKTTTKKTFQQKTKTSFSTKTGQGKERRRGVKDNPQQPKLPEKMRLQRFLAQCGIASRRHAEELIEAGKVKINGKVASLGESVSPALDEVLLNGKKVEIQHKGIALFNKPAGVVTTMRDPHGRKSISDFLPEHLKSYFPVGRLDFESIGLVVLTNDGDLADRLLHPKYEILRVYQIRVVGIPTKETLKKAAAGVKLEDGVVKADVKFLRQVEGAAWLQVTLHVGKNRVVRRMFEALGYPVRRLIRISHGPFNLGNLKSGEVRELSERQYLSVREKVMASKAGNGKRGAGSKRQLSGNRLQKTAVR